MKTPPCPRCKSAETEPLRNYGRPIEGRYCCLSCKRWFGPNNPPDAGGTGETSVAAEEPRSWERAVYRCRNGHERLCSGRCPLCGCILILERWERSVP
jgi:hypothetical protein